MKISVQDAGTCDLLGMEAGDAAIRKAGFDAIDWNLDHALMAARVKALQLGNCIFERPLEEILAHYAEELSIIRKNGLAITQCHAPFPAYIPGHPELLDYMIGIYKGVIAFCGGTAGGVLLAKLMNKLTGGRINPLIGSAGVSAVPMAARVSQKVGQQYDPGNFLLMNAMGPNVAGVIGSAVAAGVFISLFA